MSTPIPTWADPALERILHVERTQEGREFVIHQVTGRLVDGRKVAVRLPFSRVPTTAGRCIRTVLELARRDQVALGPLGFWTAFPPR